MVSFCKKGKNGIFFRKTRTIPVIDLLYFCRIVEHDTPRNGMIIKKNQ